jgi:hypothetical protein
MRRACRRRVISGEEINEWRMGGVNLNRWSFYPLVVVDACELKDHPELPAVLERNRVVLVD